MSRPSGSSQRPLRLVQPYDDDASELTSTASVGGGGNRQHLLSRGQPTGTITTTTHLDSIYTPATRDERAKREAQLHGDSRAVTAMGSFSSFPPFPPRGRHRPTPNGDFPSMSSIHGEDGVGGPDSISTRSSPDPALRPEPPVDRLAALYQQYQMPMLANGAGAALRDLSRNTHIATSPTPPPPQPPVGGTERPGPVADSLGNSVASAESTCSEVTQRQRHTSDTSAAFEPRQRGEASTLIEPKETPKDKGPGLREGRGRSRTSRSSRLFPSSVSPSPVKDRVDGVVEASAVSASRGGTRHQLEGSSVVTLPAALSGPGVEGLMNTAIHVWAALGFFEMRPNESEFGGDDDVATAAKRDGQPAGSSVLQESSDPHDTEAFLCTLEDFLCLFKSDNAAGAAATPADSFLVLKAVIRNGLWRVLFNAVFYCVTALDARRSRRGSVSGREREVRTGGPEDAYEVIFPSSSSVDDGEDRDVGVEREVPVRLTWRMPCESEQQCAARCVRDPLPPDSPLWVGGPPYRMKVVGTEGAGFRSASDRGTPSERRASPPTDLYGGRLRAPLSATDWYFTLRCLAQLGYGRDAFYLQTPSSASPFELLLALLWLTQQYKLLAVAEYVELNRRYGFVLQYHVSESFWQGPSHDAAGMHPSSSAARFTHARERLVSHFSHATVWPPVSFDETSAVHLRLLQLEHCLGRPSTHDSPQASAPQHLRPSTATLHVRRLLAVRRLISLALNRLHHALQRQTEQTLQLGLHSSLDAQLCQRKHHALYEEVMAGLKYVQQAERRMRTTAEGLAKAGSLVAFLLRYEESVVPADEVLLALEEDDATWLDHLEADATKEESLSGLQSPPQHATKTPKRTAAERWRRAVLRGTLPQQAASSSPTSAAALAQSLSTFHATHSRAALTETWKRLLRRSHVAPQTISPDNVRFLLDVEAQRIQEERVRENMKSRYSLQAALAAELAVLGHERQLRRRRSRSCSPLRLTGTRDRKRAEDSVSSRRTADADADAEAFPVQVVLPALDLVTNAASAFAQLLAEEEAYGPVTLSTAELQLTEVGEPSAGSTTSARLELERLQAWEQELDTQLDVRAQAEARVTHCKKTLEALYHQFGLRMATPIVSGKAQ